MQGGVGNGGCAAHGSKTPDLTVGNMEQIVSMNSSDFSAWIESEECNDILARALEVASEKEIEHTRKANEYASKRMDLQKALRERGAKELNEKEEVAPEEESPKHGVGTDIQNIIQQIKQGKIEGIQLAGKLENITQVEAVQLAQALEKMVLEKKSSVKTLDFSNSSIMDEGVMAFSKVIANENSLLEKVNFFSCGMTGIGATALAEALMKNKTVKLKEANIASNCITAGIDAIAKALEVNSSIIDLGLSSCYIDCGGAKSLASALKKNSALKSLDVSCNEKMGVEGLEQIAMALKENTSLEKVSFFYCGMNDDLAKKIAMVLQENHESALRDIDLGGGKITDAGADLLVQALNASNNKTVKQIHIIMSNVGCSPDNRIIV